ncbi:Complex I intermediate-associated protein 30, mitochondrial [Elsinoe australis]|uniref:Complex I intermediate-associated protein 30, mitochondrial n=1 Tax=Elsinoe australis TaxID=40998 RepID=A0A2P7YFU5_9PEZI|nr:Complex I intermediate-associated protein 30, mitochondrial [Elsinoe australis]
MQCTRRLYAQAGFWSRSMNEFKRLSRIAVNMETLEVPKKPYHLIKFDNPEKVDELKLMADFQQGGFSKADITHHEETATEPSHIRFKGSISTELPPSRQDIQRSGYAAFRTKDFGRTIFGQWFWDVDPYAFLAMKIKSDGRRYHINIQTDSLVPTDIHQHRLYTTTPGEWETVVVRFSDFVRTNYGMPVEPQSEMMKNKLKSVGIGLIDRVPGPFDISIAEIYATNYRSGQDAAEARKALPEQQREQKEKKQEEPEKILM